MANLECGADYEEVSREVSVEFESEFIAKNREIQEQIREAQRDGQSPVSTIASDSSVKCSWTTSSSISARTA